jgi:hypothetical protein
MFLLASSVTSGVTTAAKRNQVVRFFDHGQLAFVNLEVKDLVCFGLLAGEVPLDLLLEFLQYCFDLTSHKYCPSSTKRESFSCSFVLFQLNISSILPRTKTARR